MIKQDSRSLLVHTVQQGHQTWRFCRKNIVDGSHEDFYAGDFLMVHRF